MGQLTFYLILFLNFIQINNAITANVCPPVCMIYCEYGNVLDANGCPTCNCNPAPICEPVLCDLQCHNGFATGEDGCEICACAPTVCGPVVCDMYCANGWAKDEFGCEICQCHVEAPDCNFPGSSIMCKMYCPYGFVKREDGCYWCKCAPAPCSSVVCEIDCPNGLKKDSNKCDICECSEDPITDCSNIICPAGTECRGIQKECGLNETGIAKVQWKCLPFCPAVKCIACNSGYVIDKSGCQTCQCRDPCERNNCLTGNKCVPTFDESGYMCVPECPLYKCLPCKSGYVVNSLGCQTCQCKDPCERNDCLATEKCEPVNTDKRYMCVPTCSCPPVLSTKPICINIWNPCAAGCPRGTKCCEDQSGCSFCYKCFEFPTTY